MTSEDVITRLQALGDPAAARVLQGFFKTGPGGYGEGDVFVGVKVPTMRKLVREFRTLPLGEVDHLLASEIHEARLTGLLLLVYQFEKGDEKTQKEIHKLYLNRTACVNNWDLVDSSAPQLVGGYLVNRKRSLLDRLARSSSLWERRIAIVATQFFLRQGEFEDTVRIARLLLRDQHDLIHKAVGWMLREVGKRDVNTLETFLSEHARDMPRTMLRYAIEHFSPKHRKQYLAGEG
jgi:3-methyladenine DNA glycosylase AlkD